MNKLNRKIKIKLLLVSSLTAVIFLFQHFDLAMIHNITALIEDAKFSLNQPSASAQIVLVDIDEESINELGRWPWDRKTVATLINKLSAADAIVLDIIFSEKTNPAADKLIADAVAQNNVVTGFFFRNDSNAQLDTATFNALSECAYQQISADSAASSVIEFQHVESNIYDILSRNNLCAALNIFADPDGLYRRYSMAYVYKGSIYPTLAIKTLSKHLNTSPLITLKRSEIQSVKFNDHISIESSDFIIKPVTNYHRISAVDVLKGKVSSKDWAGKIVLIGITEMGVFDLRATPLDPVKPGVLIHYDAIDNLLTGNILQESRTGENIYLAAAPLLLFIISLIISVKRRYLAYSAAILAGVAFSYSLYVFAGLWLPEGYFVLSFLGGMVLFETVSYYEIEKQDRLVRKAFSSYVSPHILNQLLEKRESLGLSGQEKIITVLFTDVRNFTSISEKLSPAETVAVLNKYFEPMTQSILNQGGMLDKYIGDAIMAIFNAPIDLEDHAIRACRCALEMSRISGEISQSSTGITLSTGIGINTGNAVVGNMGSSIRFSYTAIGDAVNLSSRLESLNKFYGTNIIISEYTRSLIGNNFLCRTLDIIRVKGRAEPVRIFELMSENEKNRKLAELYENAFTAYCEKSFDAAIGILAVAISEYADPAAKILLERCRAYQQTGTQSNWEPVWNMESK